MAINLSTAGITLSYAVGGDNLTTASAISALTFKNIPGVKSTPSLNPAPETLESTTLNETEWKTYVSGLKDLGGALEFTFNLTQELIDIWEGTESAGGVMDEYATAIAKSPADAMYFKIDIPGLTQKFYFKGEPSSLGLPETSVNSVLETVVYITPTAAPIMG